MRVEVWLKRLGYPIKEVELADVYKEYPNKAVLLVENQEEYDFFSGVRFLYGYDLKIAIAQDTGTDEFFRWNRDYLRIFLTYNPYDRNRI